MNNSNFEEVGVDASEMFVPTDLDREQLDADKFGPITTEDEAN